MEKIKERVNAERLEQLISNQMNPSTTNSSSSSNSTVVTPCCMICQTAVPSPAIHVVCIVDLILSYLFIVYTLLSIPNTFKYK